MQTELSSEVNASDERLWDEILQNSSLPDYESVVAFIETQGGEDADECSDATADPKTVEHSDTDSENAEPVQFNEESDDHVSDLVTHVYGENASSDEGDYDYLYDPGDEREIGHDEHVLVTDIMIGRRLQREDEVKRTREPKRVKVETKRIKRDNAPRRPGLREVNERRPPDRYEAYAVTSAFRALHADRRGQSGIRASDVKIPRTYREAMRSKYAKQWKAAMDEEIQALKDEEVLRIPRAEMPIGQQTIKTMWVYDVKVDHLGYVIRFRSRIVARETSSAKASITMKHFRQ
ncbi:reverse transcriptase [Phytophthora palmivora]|uniref:Reverse transcriptase n=1 Tax=Phytophthora palmivora TaxID=4796 RepID=A0A2P4X329_9STRA|nr:reverse transcriptase [Phytophthora palmivora]